MRSQELYRAVQVQQVSLAVLCIGVKEQNSKEKQSLHFSVIMMGAS